MWKFVATIILPESVTSIGDRAFNCENLSTVISLIENPIEIEQNVFHNNTYKNATLYIPKGTMDRYKSTPNWYDFLFIEEGIPSNIEINYRSDFEVDNDNLDLMIYDMNGKRLENTQKGINIIRKKDGNVKKFMK